MNEYFETFETSDTYLTLQKKLNCKNEFYSMRI